MDEPRHPPAYSHPLRLTKLRGSGVQEIRVAPDAEACAEIAAELGLLGLRKVQLTGRLIPEGRADWRLEADLGATVVQPCVASLAPVTTRIDTPVTRRYLADLPDASEGEEVEMPDDEVEPLPAILDLGALLTEELALALPLYPHAEGAGPVEAAFAAPGVTPMTDEETKPLAGLKALRDRLKGSGE